MIGQKLNNRYLITTRLGEGGMGQVYQATDEQTGHQVAVKVLARQLTAHMESLERFRREAETLRQLKHPNIVEFVDAFEYEEQYVIVMEYVQGGSLQELIKQGPLPIERARQIALDLCDALIRAHRLNIIHRDIKPENVLLTEDGTPKLADFGVARLSEQTHLTRSGTQVGTPYYMAPEAWQGKALDAQADIWSLGVLLFEMLTGQVPFNGDTPLIVMNMVNTTPPPDMKKLRAEIPLTLTKIVNRMLTRDKNRRYQTMRQVGVDLESNQLLNAIKNIKREYPKPYLLIAASSFILIAIFALLWFKGRSNISLTPAFPTSIQGTNPLLPTKIPFTPTPSETSIPAVGDVIVSAKDNMNLHFIPGGPFMMGSEDGDDDEKPVHKVTLDSFWIDETEVTNRMYNLCVTDAACQPPSNNGSYTRVSYYDDTKYTDYPVIYVSWDDAIAYCSWAGRKLPSEAEWEYAARWQPSADGGEALTYPWGNVAPNSNLLNFNEEVGDTTQVGQYPNGKSPYGVLDMAGNVWEWVGDLYDETFYTKSPSSNPIGPDKGGTRALRGGSWNNLDTGVRSSNRFRFIHDVTDYFIGFRCALND